MQNDYIVLILTHGRPDRVFTYKTLRQHGYTGRIVLVVDDLDKTKDEYKKVYGDEVVIFDKRESGKLFDVGDNFQTYRGVVYARNAAFDIVRQLGYKYFIVLDDDYKGFRFRFNDKFSYQYNKGIKNLNEVFQCMLNFYISSKIDCLAISQGGDFIGGEGNQRYSQNVRLHRKLMNLYVLSTERQFEVMGRINEDVQIYTNLGARGKIFFTMNQLSLEQLQTQTNAGGMTELYLDHGTYIKSFYSVLWQPSFVKVGLLHDRAQQYRLHHKVSWKNAVPLILREQWRKRSQKAVG